MTDPVPLVPSTFRFRMRLQTAAGIAEPFAGKEFRLHWGSDVHAGTVTPDGDVDAEVDGEYDDGVLDIGLVVHEAFVARISIPVARHDPPSPTRTLGADRSELRWRLQNLGLYYGSVAPARGTAGADLTDAVDRFVFRHYLTAIPEERDRYGDWFAAAEEMLNDMRPIDPLLEDVAAAHDAEGE